MELPARPARPLLWTTLRPIHSSTEEVRRGLAKLAEKDPTFKVGAEHAGNEILISAMGELHLQFICERLLRDHDVLVEADLPNVIYLETISQTTEAYGEFISTSGGRSHYARVLVRVEPNRGRGYEFVNGMQAGLIPQKYVEPVSKGIEYALQSGAVGGCEVVDVKAVLCEGSYHEIDSDEASFEAAGFMAIREAIAHAHPVLLEPVMLVQVEVGEEFASAVVRELASRRGVIEGIANSRRMTIHALVPLAELIGFGNEVRAATQGRATCSSAFATYNPIIGGPTRGEEEAGVVAKKPWKPKPRSGAARAEPPWSTDLSG